MKKTGAFCETYGDTIKNRILEFMFENNGLDFAVGDMANELGISKPKAYEAIKYFEEKKYVEKSRLIGKTQLYKLNNEDNRVKLLLNDFKECLKLIVEEYSEDNLKYDKEISAHVFVDGVDIVKKMVGVA